MCDLVLFGMRSPLVLTCIQEYWNAGVLDGPEQAILHAFIIPITRFINLMFIDRSIISTRLIHHIAFGEGDPVFGLFLLQ